LLSDYFKNVFLFVKPTSNTNGYFTVFLILGYFFKTYFGSLFAKRINRRFFVLDEI